MKDGDDGHGYPEYGLFFTIQPGGRIPIHHCFYHQAMYIVEGEFECWSFDPETDEMRRKKVCGLGLSIYISSMVEPHGMKNITNQPGHFLCCICNICDEDAV